MTSSVKMPLIGLGLAFGDRSYANSFEEASELVLSDSVNVIETLGYSTLGDGGGARYVKADSEPSHDLKFQNSGRWFGVPVDVAVSPRVFGSTGDGVADDTAALQAAFSCPHPVRMTRGDVHKITATVTYPSNKHIDFNGAKLVRGFADGWMLRNSTALTTNDNVDVTLVDPWLEDGGTAATRGNFLLAAGVTGMRVARLKVRGDAPDEGAGYGAWAQYYEGGDISVEGADIDTSGCGIYGDGLHVGYVKVFVYTDFHHKAGDDAIALYHPPDEYTFIGTNAASEGVYIGSGYVESAHANGIRFGAASTAANARVWKRVTFEGITFGPCENTCIDASDLRGSGNIVDQHEDIVFRDMNFGTQDSTRLVNVAGNPDITSAANYEQHNFADIHFDDLTGSQAGDELVRAGGAALVALRDYDLRHVPPSAVSATPLTFYQVDDLRVGSGYALCDSTANCLSLTYVLRAQLDNVVIEDANPAFRCINLALNSDQATSLHVRGGALLNTVRGIDDTGTGTITDFVVAGTDIQASSAIYVLAATPGGRDIRKDLSVI